jgi:hypothetical protein
MKFDPHDDRIRSLTPVANRTSGLTVNTSIVAMSKSAMETNSARVHLRDDGFDLLHGAKVDVAT